MLTIERFMEYADLDGAESALERWSAADLRTIDHPELSRAALRAQAAMGDLYMVMEEFE